MVSPEVVFPSTVKGFSDGQEKAEEHREMPGRARRISVKRTALISGSFC